MDRPALSREAHLDEVERSVTTTLFVIHSATRILRSVAVLTLTTVGTLVLLVKTLVSLW